MNKILKGLAIGACSLLIATFFALVGFAAHKSQSQTRSVGGSSVQQRVSYDTIGTATASSTLTTVYTGNTKIISAPSIENLHFDIQYKPGATNQYLSLLVETSNDNGVTYFPFAAKSVSTSSIAIYVKDPSNATGTPMIIPGDLLSSASVPYLAGVDFDVVADHIRISAKESGSAGGRLYVRTTLTSQ